MNIASESSFPLLGGAALITGAAGGIGRAMATAFSRAGAKVALVDADRGGLGIVAREINAAGGTALSVPLDLAETGDIAAAITSA
ncbi:SDR family NAD(P)-dependent oxidoreductase [Flavisphingomonas formosensis]|uniref:SDR family NAD(P)-dependent oxidoreductase n=1 Tax=Flavisphingomonas formosensis TaxID=861534 RepID=UPI0012FBBA9B|nr:SDR family NAD(P)-dependent oxidoreductase [Sphingomonas formosensis]